jgi:hypothetical protein
MPLNRRSEFVEICLRISIYKRKEGVVENGFYLITKLLSITLYEQ